MKRMGSKALIPITIVALVLLSLTTPPAHSDIGSIPRVFYLSTSKTLTTAPPSIGLPDSANLTKIPLEFDFPQPFLSATLSGSMIFELYLISNQTLPGVTIAANFLERGPALISNQTVLSTRPITTNLQPINFTYPIQNLILTPGAQISISIMLVQPLPKGVYVRLFWGSSVASSLVLLPLSGYVTLVGTNPIAILDRSNSLTNTFDVNVTNVVTIQVLVGSMLGSSDISRVNLTLIDPMGHSVKGATDIPMNQFPPPNPSSPFVPYTVTWVYTSNSTTGAYLVYIDIFDIQNNHAFSFRGPATFTLFRTPNLFTRTTLNLLPYALGATVIAVPSLIYYNRKRKTKSYLVPFDYFNTLTSGELDGGTLVTVEGNTGSGKTILSEELMFEDLKKGRHCIFVATGDFPTNVREGMKSMGLDTSGYETSGLLTFVDGYSSEAGQESREKIFVPSLGDLTTLSMKISSSLQTNSFKEGSLFFDSLTPLAAKTKPESLISFVQSVGAKVRGLGGKVFFTLGPSIDGTVQRRLEDMADCVVQMEAFEERGVRKSRMRISKLRSRRFQQGWVIYTIEEGKGIIFYSKKPRQ